MSTAEENIQRIKDEALINFMVNAVSMIFPYQSTYPYEELRRIEEIEGEDSERWNEYSDKVQRCYWMKRDIEIISNGRIRF